ncbi:MAG: HAMP domain-containing histidine kinase [Sandaracinaceae bacterium]|nr:HAMP domain-containing histidine kinase [Sandaracinaceae bacterium]
MPRPSELPNAPGRLQSWNGMRLFTRLVVSHTVPLLVLTAALALVLVALGRLTQRIADLGEDELNTLGREGALHHANWDLDLAMRASVGRCARGQDAQALADVGSARDALHAQLDRSRPVSDPLADASRGYLALADRALASDVCGAGPEVEAARDELDARITTIWVERLAELNAAARAEEVEAHTLGVSALVGGVLLAAIAIVLAFATARRMAREIGEPLAAISATSRRLAKGDFGQPVEASGPAEIEELADELEAMRVRLAELDSLKQGFLASVSHELRTPLSKIREALALLADGATGPLSDRQTRVVSIARTACEREIRLVTTLLDLSRLRAGVPLRRRPDASIDDIVSLAVADEEGEAKARKVSLETAREGGAAPKGPLDEVLVERAVANLVRNAVAVSKSGQTVRVVRSIERVDGSPTAVVRVSDQGPGVPESVRKMLFEPFVTVPVEGSPKAVGVGLGLSLSREVARAHGGELELDAGEAGGATFVLRLPLEPAGSVTTSNEIQLNVLGAGP